MNHYETTCAIRKPFSNLNSFFNPLKQNSYPWITACSSERKQNSSRKFSKFLDGVGKVSPSGWAHLYLSVYFYNMFLCQWEKGEYEEGGEKEWELTLCLKIDVLWSIDNPMPELTLNLLHR